MINKTLQLYLKIRILAKCCTLASTSIGASVIVSGDELRFFALDDNFLENLCFSFSEDIAIIKLGMCISYRDNTIRVKKNCN